MICHDFQYQTINQITFYIYINQINQILNSDNTNIIKSKFIVPLRLHLPTEYENIHGVSKNQAQELLILECCFPVVVTIWVRSKNLGSLGRFNFGILNTALLLLSALAAWLSYSEFYGCAETCNILRPQASVSWKSFFGLTF